MRFFAIIPAAGHSRRMGRPKLLLPLPTALEADEQPLISWALASWRAANVDAIVAVVRSADDELADVCQAGGAVVVRPNGNSSHDPVDMKASVALGLDFIRQEYSPTDEDCWMLAPADMPLLRPRTIRAVMEACERETLLRSPVVPVSRGKRGHPAVFPWALADEVGHLAVDEGVKALFEKWPPLEVEVEDAFNEFRTDVDTPQQYQGLRDWLQELLTDGSENP